MVWLNNLTMRNLSLASWQMNGARFKKGKPGLPKGALSDRDEKKISDLQLSFRNQLIGYKMGSVDPHELNISRDYYQPEIAGLNLGADVSGSDLIRMQWAYLLGLLEVGISSADSNHPGLLIMDEPQQQSVEESSFRAMLRYASSRKGHPGDPRHKS